ncbi:MAG: DUF1499 domain-containing protein [Burkholderiaceae bacterium]|nr:DUF1499 domain-containing protein [Burkholderiaceae bacterium]
MSVLRWGLSGLTAVVLLAVLAGQLGLWRGQAPGDLGLWPGHPQREAARIEPLALVGDGPATLQRLHDIVAAMPGARIVRFEGDYLRAEFTTSLMQFTDDAEFWLDREAGVVQVRSASRLGRSDLGANRRRIEAIRAGLKSG